MTSHDRTRGACGAWDLLLSRINRPRSSSAAAAPLSMQTITGVYAQYTACLPEVPILPIPTRLHTLSQYSLCCTDPLSVFCLRFYDFCHCLCFCDLCDPQQNVSRHTISMESDRRPGLSSKLVNLTLFIQTWTHRIQIVN